MADLDLDALAAEHPKCDNRYPCEKCHGCYLTWPCPTTRLIAEARRARELEAAARKIQADYGSAAVMAWAHGWRTDPANALTGPESDAWQAALTPEEES